MVVLYQDGEKIRRDAKGTCDIRTIYCVCTPIDEYYVKYTNIVPEYIRNLRIGLSGRGSKKRMAPVTLSEKFTEWL